MPPELAFCPFSGKMGKMGIEAKPNPRDAGFRLKRRPKCPTKSHGSVLFYYGGFGR